MFSCKIFENLKNTYFEDHQGATAPERRRKISPLLELGKLLLDGKRHNCATNSFYQKYEPHEASLCSIHVIPKWLLLFLSGLRRGQKW